MSGRTSSVLEEEKNKIGALMGTTSGNEDFNVLVEGTFHIDEDRQKRFRNRITIKDYGITERFSQIDVATEDIEELSRTKELPEWLLNKIKPFFTNEYIAIKRKEHILHMLEQIQIMESVLEDKTSLSMYFKIFLNEISTIYRNFLETRQDEQFLSIVNLLEETLQRNDLNKKLLKESASVLKDIKDKDSVEYRDYEQAVSRFFNIGADIVTIKEMPNEE